MRDLGLLAAPGVARRAAAEPASDDDLVTVHDARLRRGRQGGVGPAARPDLAHGLGTEDVPVFEGMHDATALIAGGSVAAARAVSGG